jgi:phage major head subunit gpT-like protein
MRMEDLKFEKLPLFAQNIETLAMQAEKLIDYEAANYLKVNTHVGFDGKVLFAIDHPTTGGDVTMRLPTGTPATQSNFDTTTPLPWDYYVAARAKMMSYLAEDGKPLNIDPDLLVVPPQLQGIAKNILEADMIANAATGLAGSNIVQAQNNTFKGTARLFIDPNLATMPQSWFLADTRKAISPLVWGQLEAPIFTYLIDPKSPNVFFERKYIYGWSRWGTLTESLWYLIYGATGGAAYGD